MSAADDRGQPPRPPDPVPPGPEPLPEGEEAPPPWVHGMAIVRWVLIGLMAGAAVGTWLHFFDALPHAAARVGALYHCPMHPAVVMDHPGECPICGMSLVAIETPRHAAASQPASGPAAVPIPGVAPVMLSAERVRLAGLRTAPVARERSGPGLRTVGFVVANEQGLARIHPRFSGWIEDLLVPQTGQRVERGQVLATIYSPELVAAQQDFLNVTRWLAAAGGAPATAAATARLVEDARRKLELLGVAREELDEVARTGRPLRALKVRATATGYVTQKAAVRGLYVQPATELFQVADLRTVWVTADVYEHELSRVRVGGAARLTVSAHPAETFSGRVQFIYPTLNAETRTLRVRLEFENPGLKLKPGYYGTVVLDLPAREGLAIPAEAVVDTGAAVYVYVARPDHTYEPRRVKLGARTDARVQVVAGLAAGDEVVTTGNFVLDAEARLRAAIEGSAPPAVGAAGGAADGGRLESIEGTAAGRRH
jgi:membrane fusion protein, copper/silver efflux system